MARFVEVDECDCPACQVRRNGGTFVAWLEAIASSPSAIIISSDDDDDDDDDDGGGDDPGA